MVLYPEKLTYGWTSFRGAGHKRFTMWLPRNLKVFYKKWETKWHESGGKDINNPKIPLTFVIERGELLYGQPPTPRTVVGLPKEVGKEQPEF